MAGAGFKDFTVGQILTSAEVDTYLQQQVVCCFASTTARDSAIAAPSEGMMAFTTDTDTFWVYDGSAWQKWVNAGAWTTFTPSWSSLTVGNASVNTGSYAIVGKTCVLKARITLGSTSSVSSNPVMTLPVTAKDGVSYPVGGAVLDNSYYGYTFIPTTTTLQMRVLDTSSTYATAALVTSTVPVTWASGKQMMLHATYEIA